MKAHTFARLSALSLVGAFFVGAAASPAAACTSQLQAAHADWHAMALPMPVKPNQARVVGPGGHEMTAGQYNYVHSQLRHAHRECAAGHTARAAARGAHAHGVIARAARRSAPNAPERFVANTDALQ